MILWNGFKVPSTCSVAQKLLDIRHAHVRDDSVAFDEIPHKYWVKGVPWTQSITGAIGDLFPSFDALAVATKMVNGQAFAHCRGDKAKYKFIVDRWRSEELSTDEVCEAVLVYWEQSNGEASRLGTEMHAAIEDYYNQDEAKRLAPATTDEAAAASRSVRADDAVCGRAEFAQFEEYANEMAQRGWVPYRTEMRVFDDDTKLVGSVDMIFIDTKTQEFHLRDWKRSKKISKRAFSKSDRGLGAFSDIEVLKFHPTQKDPKPFLTFFLLDRRAITTNIRFNSACTERY